MNDAQQEAWRDQMRDAVAYLHALHRGDDEAAELLLDHGNPREIAEAAGLLFIGTMRDLTTQDRDPDQAVNQLFDDLLARVAPKAVTE